MPVFCCRYPHQTILWYSFWFAILLFQALSAEAQVNSSETFFSDDKRHEVGANVTTVLFSALGNASNQIDPGRFPWSYKYRFAKGNAFRLGIGVSVNVENQDRNQFTTFNQFGSLRLGYEWRTYLDKRWLTYFGIDAIGDYTVEQAIVATQFDFTTIKLESIGIGGGPVFGLQFALTKRIILGTEASLYGIYAEKVRTELFSNNPGGNDRITSNQFTGDLTIPRWLYLSIRF
ncbi:MAG: hypothetical protein AAF587_35760 [Bacteroidota bacterium]